MFSRILMISKTLISKLNKLAVSVNYHGISFDRQFEQNPYNDTCPTRQ